MLYAFWLHLYNLYTVTLKFLSKIYTIFPTVQFNIVNIYSFLVTKVHKTTSVSTTLNLTSVNTTNNYKLSVMQWFTLSGDILVNFHRTYLTHHINQIAIRFFGVGLFYIYYSTFIMYIDACLTDDEPIWEPIEWSLVQTWILFLFTFAWIAENLIVSRYGSYTGRDKRVWFAWYKTFWLMELYYIINF